MYLFDKPVNQIMLFIFLFLLISSAAAFAQSDKERIKMLEEKLNQVTQELDQMRSEGGTDTQRLDRIEEKISVLAEEISEVKAVSVGEESNIELKEIFGGAPGASKVYQKVGRGLSIGGYGELAIGKIPDDGNNIIDAQRVVMYLGYKFTDHIIFNSEIEFEHGTTSSNQDDRSGSVSVEFALIDFLL